MTMANLVLAILVILFFVSSGSYWIHRGYKRGFVDMRIERWGKWYEGEDAKRLGMVAILFGLANWGLVIYWAISWFSGRAKS